jgi:single-stranded-DNA-specific exonuclease
MKYRWSIAPSNHSLAAPLAQELSISALLAHCLVNRGYTTSAVCADFLQPRLKQLADPFLLPQMGAAVDRLFQARDRAEPLVIFGDYDVDGVTSTALLTEVLRALGWAVFHYLPHRMDEGYGLSRDGVENCLLKHPVKLLLAVDCGSNAVDTIAWLNGQGVDVLVLDHHQVAAPVPAALALVNPQLAPPGAPDFRELCSAGLAFKLAHALVKRGRELGLAAAVQYDLRPLLDLVALGTIADLVPLTGENRILASAGLDRLNRSERPGILALRRVAQLQGTLGSWEVGFALGPRLNAAGRLENASQALDLILARDRAQAEPLAQALDARNRERQEIERGIVEEVITAVRARFNPEQDFVIVEGQMRWHIGVVGIVASRVLREFHRPTLILGGESADWRGSGRSIEGFDLAAALRECNDLLLRHGGHAMAAGITVRCDNVDALRRRLNDLARAALTPEQLQPVLRLDSEVKLGDLSLERLQELAQLEPMGQANPPVQFAVRRVRHQRPPQRMGREQQHVKFWVTDAPVSGPVRSILETVWWNARELPQPTGTFDLAFAPQINEFNGTRSVQLKCLDWRPSA